MKKHFFFLIFLFSFSSVFTQSTLDTTQIIDKWGEAKGSYCSRSDIVDIFGTLRGASNFDSLKVLDKFGTFGSITCTPPSAAFIGYLNLAGQTVDHTNRVKWSTSGQTLQVPTQAQIANNMVIIGCIAGTEIIATGSILTTSHLFIAGPARNINTQTPPGTQKGGGIVKLVDPQTVGINGVTGFFIDVGATLWLGIDWTKKHGWFYSPAGNAQLGNSGTLEVRSLSYTDVDQQNGGNTASTGIIRYIGKPDGTTFYNTCLSPNTYGQNITNLGLIEVDNCAWRPRSIATSGPGTTRVKTGGTLITTIAGNVDQKIFINGNGASAPDFPKIALGLETGKNYYTSSTIELESNATIAFQSGFVTGFGYFPPIVSTASRTLTIGCPTVGGAISPGYGSAGYTSLQAANPNLLGPVVVDYGTLGLHVANAMPNSAGLTVNPNARIASPTSNTVTNLTMVDANSILAVTNTSGILTATTLTASSGFKVDLTATMPAGTYTIMTAINGDKPIPTLGVNNSGRPSATFTWVGNNLRMTI